MKCRPCVSYPELIQFFYGEKLLTTDNPVTDSDQRLFQRLGVRTGAIQH